MTPIFLNLFYNIFSLLQLVHLFHKSFLNDLFSGIMSYSCKTNGRLGIEHYHGTYKQLAGIFLSFFIIFIIELY